LTICVEVQGERRRESVQGLWLEKGGRGRSGGIRIGEDFECPTVRKK